MKSKVLYGLVLCVVVGIAAVAADDAKKDKKTDHDNIQGTWEAVSVEDNGRTLTKEQIKGLTFVFGKDTITITFPFTGETLKWPYAIDPSKKPAKWIDITYIATKGEEPYTMLGIYELDGDTLKICYTEYHPKREGQRATAFESKKGSANMFVVLKRKK